MEHVCCGFTCDTEEEMKAHINRDNCPVIAGFVTGEATVVHIGNQSIVAGHPEAVARHLKHQAKVKNQEFMVRIDRQITKVEEYGLPTSEFTNILDDFWTHLKSQDLVRDIPDDLLEAIRSE